MHKQWSKTLMCLLAVTWRQWWTCQKLNGKHAVGFNTPRQKSPWMAAAEKCKKKKKNFHQTENDTFKWESSAKTTAKRSSTAPFSIISNPALPIMKAKWEYLEGMKNNLLWNPQLTTMPSFIYPVKKKTQKIHNIWYSYIPLPFRMGTNRNTWKRGADNLAGIEGKKKTPKKTAKKTGSIAASEKGLGRHTRSST